MDRVETDEGTTLWHVVYDDFDEEQFNKEELAKHLAYHPLLEHTSELDVPAVGSFVWFAMDHQPFLGQVLSVDPTVPRPLVVKVFAPARYAESLERAKYEVTMEEDGEPQVRHITLHQVRINFAALSKRGFLPAKVRGLLRRCLTA